MRGAWLIVVCLTAVAAGAWLWLRNDGGNSSDRKGSDSASTGSARLTPAVTPPRVPVAVPSAPSLAGEARPSLPPVDDGGAPSTLPTQEEKFAEESFESGWKAKTEAELATRLKPVPNVKSYECRQTQCLIVIAGNENEVGRSVSALESDHAMHELAHNIILTAPIRKPDGTLELHAFAQFER